MADPIPVTCPPAAWTPVRPAGFGETAVQVFGGPFYLALSAAAPATVNCGHRHDTGLRDTIGTSDATLGLWLYNLSAKPITFRYLAA